MTATTDRLLQRIRIHARDGGQCQLCGEAVTYDEMHLDHILPRSLGGSDDDGNLRTTHPSCNLSRGNAYGNAGRVRLPKTYPDPAIPIRGHRARITIAEAVDRTGLDRTTLARQIRRGSLAAEKSGKTWLIDADELARYQKENKGKPGRKPATPTPPTPLTPKDEAP